MPDAEYGGGNSNSGYGSAAKDTKTSNSVSNGSQSNSRTDRAPSSPSKTSSPQGSASRDGGARAGVGANAPGTGGKGGAQGSQSNSRAPNSNAGQPRNQKTGAAPGDQGLAGLKNGLGIGKSAVSTAYKARDDRMPSTSSAMKKTIDAAAPKKTSSITDYKGLTKVADLGIGSFSNIAGKTALEKAPAPVTDDGILSGSYLSERQKQLDAEKALTEGILGPNTLTTADPDLQKFTNPDYATGTWVNGNMVYNPTPVGAVPTPRISPLKQSPQIATPRGLEDLYAPAKNAAGVTFDQSKLNPDAQKMLNNMKLAAFNEGTMVRAYSGKRNSGSINHDPGYAVDMKILDPATGKALNPGTGKNAFGNYQSPENFDDYEKYAQAVRAQQTVMNPELDDRLRWGGYFGARNKKTGALDPAGYGAMDLMHFDVTPGTRMAQGDWAGGLSQAMREAYPDAVSAGINERTQTAQFGNPPTTTVASGVPLAPAATSNIPRPQPKPSVRPASVPDITRPPNVEPHIAAVDAATKAALSKTLSAALAGTGYAVDALGNITRAVTDKVGITSPATPSPSIASMRTKEQAVQAIDDASWADFNQETARLQAELTAKNAATRAALSSTFPARPEAIASNTVPSTPSTFPARPSVVANNTVPTKKADYRVNEDGTITDLRTNTEISQTPPATTRNVTVVPKQVAAAVPVPRQKPAQYNPPVSGPPARAIMPATKVPSDVAQAISPPIPQQSPFKTLGPGQSFGPTTPATTGNYTDEEIASQTALTNELNKAALKDTEIPTAEEVFDAREQNLNVLADDPTALDKAKKVGGILRDVASVLANPVVGITSIAARKAYNALKTQREKDQYLKENYPATWAAEQGRREAQRTQTASRDEGGDNRIFETKTGVTMSEDDMALIGSLPDAERQRLVRLSKTNPSVFQAELASIRSASSPSIPASTNANQLQQIFAAFV